MKKCAIYAVQTPLKKQLNGLHLVAQREISPATKYNIGGDKNEHFKTIKSKVD